MKIDPIKNGIVLDHIEAGKGMKVYNFLNLDELDCTVALIKNVPSKKTGKKDIIKIEETVSLDNMYLFNSNLQINKYETVNEIFSTYASKRFELYKLRKEKMVKQKEMELILLQNKLRFIQKIVNKELDIKENCSELRKKMENMNFTNIEQLLNTPIRSLTKDEQNKLEKTVEDKTNELEMVKNKKIEIMWKEELINLKKYLQ
jgi:DNA gyrase/topoisomerase IV subunit A